MAEQGTTVRASAVAKDSKDDHGSIGEVIDLVKNYARQETVGPLRGAGRWLAFGLAGALCLGLGAAFVVLGVLRLLEHEFAPTFRGRWMSLLPYLIAFVTSLVVIGLAVSRIGKTSLNAHDQPSGPPKRTKESK